MKKQNTIHTSFPDDELGLYKRLITESNLKYIPVATLNRHYIKLGMKVADQQQRLLALA